ncbi:MAG: hypothetical protein ACYDD6_01735 [Acidimicrobiales bacterium]
MAMAAMGADPSARRIAAARHAVGAFMRRRPGAARAWLVAMMAVAVFAQVFVWGAATPSGTGGALLPGLRPWFGVGYAVALIVIELLFCACYDLPGGAVAVLVTGAVVDAVFWIVRAAGLHFPTGDAAALTAGFGAVVLGAGVFTGVLPPPGTRHPTPRARQ